MDFEQQKKQKTEEINRFLTEYMPEESGEEQILCEAMNYSVAVGGKRIRPMLLLEAYTMFGGTGDGAQPFAAALEMIHTYSLVHDDLPAMDNDEYRRGKKTTWAQFDECTAILAGDGLLNFAFETALNAETENNPYHIKALGILAKKAGIYGMIGGQTADIEAEKTESNVDGEKCAGKGICRTFYIHITRYCAILLMTRRIKRTRP